MLRIKGAAVTKWSNSEAPDIELRSKPGHTFNLSTQDCIKINQAPFISQGISNLQGDQMRLCKNRQHFTKKAQITKYSPPKKRYRPSKKVPVSSIQAKKSPTDLQK